MGSIFRIDMLPAKDGDCLWIEYGEEDRPRRLLIDGGRHATYDALKARFDTLPADQREFELAILTHVDADHIEGFLRLVKDPGRGVEFKDFWFNGYHHLTRKDQEDLDEELVEFGAVQGEDLTDALVAQQWQWNWAFDRASAVVPDDGELAPIPLEGGMRLTLLSPTWPKLKKMRGKWEREVEKAGLVPGVHVPEEEEIEFDQELESFAPLGVDEVDRLASVPFEGDDSEANGSSIAVLAEYGGKRALFTGDAHADILAAAIDRLVEPGERTFAVDAFKISHHGSRRTLSSELLQKVHCPRYLISTNGSRHRHPDREAIARILKHGGRDKELFFNYRTDFTLAWDVDGLKQTFKYATVYPEQQDDGTMRLELI